MPPSRGLALSTGLNWLSRVLVIILNLTLLPFLFMRFSQEELGAWLLLLQASALLTLMDLGVSPTLTRFIAFSTSGDSASPGAEDRDGSSLEFNRLATGGFALYRVLALGTLVFGSLVGLLILSPANLTSSSRQGIWLSWFLLCGAGAIENWTNGWRCVLSGVGYIGWDTIIQTLVACIVITLQVVVVVVGGGIVELALMILIGASLTRLGILLLVRSTAIRVQSSGFSNSICGTWKCLASPALKAWLTTLGALLILRTDQYFIAYFRNVAEIPSYHAGYQLVSNVAAFALASGGMTAVLVSQAWRQKREDDVRLLVKRNLRFGLIIMSCGISCLVMTGQELCDLWLGERRFVGYLVLGTFCALFFLETQHVLLAQCCRATDEDPFAPWALASAGLNLVLTWFLVSRLGLWGVALGTFVAQLVTNNWFVVYRSLRRMRISLRAYFSEIVGPVICVFVIALTLTGVLVQVVGRDWSAMARLMAGASTSMIIGVCALWRLVLSDSHRQRVLERLGLARRAPR